MSNKAEVLYVDQRIDDLIRTDTTIKSLMGITTDVPLFVGVAPEGNTANKWVTYDLVTSPDTAAMGGDHVATRPTYTIRVCGNGCGFQALRPIIERINQLVGQEGVTIDDVYVGKFIRRNVMRNIDDEKGLRVFWIAYTYILMSYEI